MNKRCQPSVRLSSLFRNVFILALGLCSSSAFAQARDLSAPGFELQLSSTGTAYQDAPLVLRGRSYDVTDLATLTPAARAIEVRFEFENLTESELAAIPWHTFSSGDDGHFVTTLGMGDPGEGILRFRAADAVAAQVEDTVAVTVPLRVSPSAQILLRTDRRFYERDEPVHAWGLVTDARTGVPLPHREVVFTLHDGEHSQSVPVSSDAAGVVYHRFQAQPGRGGNDGGLDAQFARSEYGSVGDLRITFGDRTREPLFVEVEMPEPPTMPGGAFEVGIRVVGAAGQILPGVHLRAVIGSVPPFLARPAFPASSVVVEAVSGPDGRAQLHLQAPALTSSTGTTLHITATDAAYGTVAVERLLTIGRPGRLRISTHAQNGALMTGVRSRVWVSVLTDGGRAAPEGTQVRLQGPRLDLVSSTDGSGIAEFEVTADLDDTGPFRHCNTGLGLSVSIVPATNAPSVTPRPRAGCVQVVDDAWVRPVVSVRAQNPGDEIEVAIERAASARSQPVTVELSVAGQVVSAIVTRDTRASFEVPAIYGVARITTRLASPLADGRSRPALSDIFLILPERREISVESLSPTWPVPGEATVRVTTSEEGWLTVNVRDLAQHGGEFPFEEGYWTSRFRHALRHPAGQIPTRLLAVVLEPWLRSPHWHNGAPMSSVRNERAPFALAEAFYREGAAPLYRALEQRLAHDASIGEGRGSRRRFRPDAIADLQGFAGRPARPRDLERADRSFSFRTAASRVSRVRLLKVLVALRQGERSDDPDRWVSALVHRQALETTDIVDPWGGALGWRRRAADVPVFFPERPTQALAFPGPDGRLGTADDIDHPFRRIIARGTPYAKAVGEDALMERVAMLPVGLVALENMRQAMRQVTQAMTDARRGDAAQASAIEADDGGGLGSYDNGGFGFGGTGTGSVGSGFGGGRGSHVPRVRSGHASIAPGLGSALLAAVRDEFPGTLFFDPVIPVHRAAQALTTAPIQTDVTIPLAGATTTYVVDVVHWRADGWRQSARTRFHTRLPLMVSAPLPEFANVGDVLEIPARIESGTAGQTVVLSLREDGRLVSRSTLETAGVGRDVTARLSYTPDRVQETTLTVAVEGEDRRDAIGAPIRIRRPMLRQERSRHVLSRNHAWVQFSRPGQIRLHVDTRGFGMDYGDIYWRPWAERNSGRSPADGFELGHALLRDERSWGLALGLALAWRDPELSDADIREALEREQEAFVSGYDDAVWLIVSGPVLSELERRPSLRRLLTQIANARRARLMRAVMSESNDPTLFAMAAAVLAQSDNVRDRERAMQLVVRARRFRLNVGDSTWVHYSPSTTGERTAGRGVTVAQDREASAALAYADTMLGEYDEALALLRTLARSSTTGRSGPAMNLAFAAARLDTHDISYIVVQTDAGRQRVEIVDGQADLLLEVQARETIRVHGPGALLNVGATLAYERPWDEAIQAAERDAPVRLRLEGPTEVAGLERSRWSMSIRNHRHDVISRLVVRIGLPAGADLDSESMTDLRERYDAHQSEGELTLVFGPLFPGRSTRFEFALRHRLGGQMTGLGVVATAAGRDDRMAVLAPRRLRVAQTERGQGVER